MCIHRLFADGEDFQRYTGARIRHRCACGSDSVISLTKHDPLALFTPIRLAEVLSYAPIPPHPTNFYHANV